MRHYSQMNAAILQNEVPVQHSVRPDVGLEFLQVSCPDGWDDVKKICRKVLSYEGKKFTFSGWNSDRNVAYFNRPINQDAPCAQILKA